MSTEAQTEVLKKAHEKAHAEAKKWYLKRPGVRRQKQPKI